MTTCTCFKWNVGSTSLINYNKIYFKGLKYRRGFGGMLANQLGDSDIADVSNFYKSLMDKKSVPIESLITSYDWEIKARKTMFVLFSGTIFYVIFYYEYTRRNDERPVLRGAAGFSWSISDLFKPIGEALHNGYQSRKSRKI